MSWDHRVFRVGPDKFGEYWFGVRETYYDESGNPSACTADNVSPGGEDLSVLKREIEWFRLACEKPVLEVVGNKIVAAASNAL